jgi:predicted CXXCH cytochrome family protein
VLVAGALLFFASKRTAQQGTEPPVNSAETSPEAMIAGSIPQALPKQTGPPGYVSSSACKECHQKQFESWWHSHHRQMTQVMTTNTVQADFNGVTMDFGGERFTLHESSNQYWVDIQVIDEVEEIARTNGVPGPPLRIPMGMITGSHYFQVFWLPGGYGNQQIGFPFTWLVAEKRWVQRHDAFIRPPEAGQVPEEWNQVCIRCHATGGRPRPDPQTHGFDTQVTELGIACEACHGPGEKHVAAQRKLQREGRYPSGAPADIIQPAHLDHVRSSQVCGSCHSMKWFDESEGWKQSGFRYRPGDDLEQTTPIIRPSKLAEQPWLGGVLARNPDILEDFFWPDGMIRVAGREFNGLLESACYQKGELACVSCHSMHKSDPDKQVKADMDGNQACLTCHSQYVSQLSAHTHHPPGSSGSLCYNCHMPYTAYGLLRGIRSHQIERPMAQTTLKTGRPNACNLCHLDRSLEWTARKLSEWYGQPVPELPHEQRTVSEAARLLLSGDAGQRALAAFSLGWKPALAASDRNWQAPLLAAVLEDPYAAVRFIAHRSLMQLPGFEKFAYDFESDSEQLRESRAKALELWRSTAQSLPQRPETLTGPGPVLDTNRLEQLLSRRDNRPRHLRE